MTYATYMPGLMVRVNKFARIVCGLILEWSGTRLSSLLWPLLYYIERFSVLCSCFLFSLPAAVGLVRTMELVYHITKGTAMCAFARRNFQGNTASQVIEFSTFITSILKSLVIRAMWLVLSGAIYSQMALSFALNRIFFLGQWEWHRKTKQPIRFQGFF